MSWNRPRKVINNVLFYAGLLSLISAIFWLVIYYIWHNRPDLVQEYSSNLPETYINHIARLETRTYKGKDPEDTFKRHQILAKALEGTTSLHIYYNLYNKTQDFMIDYLIEQNKFNEAERLANEWQKNYPYEFRAKFKYYNVLKLNKKDEALKYIESVYDRYKDIEEVNLEYLDALLEQGYFDKAFELAKSQKQSHINNSVASFMLFYKDKTNKTFNSKTKVLFKPSWYRHFDNNYEIDMVMKFNQLKGLRIDIDGIKVGSIINNITMSLAEDGQPNREVTFKPLHHLTKKTEGVFIVKGSDPYFEVFVPEDLMGYEQDVHIAIQFSIEKNSDFLKDRILNDHEWKVYYSETQKFDKDHSQHLKMHHIHDEKGGTLYSTVTLEQEHYQSLRVDLPSYRNFTFSKLKLIINEGQELNEQHISLLRGIEKIDDQFVVTDNDPYVIFYVEPSLVVDELQIKLTLGDNSE